MAAATEIRLTIFIWSQKSNGIGRKTMKMSMSRLMTPAVS